MASNTPTTGDQFLPPKWAQILKFVLSLITALCTAAGAVIGATRWL